MCKIWKETLADDGPNSLPKRKINMSNRTIICKGRPPSHKLVQKHHIKLTLSLIHHTSSTKLLSDVRHGWCTFHLKFKTTGCDFGFRMVFDAMSGCYHLRGLGNWQLGNWLDFYRKIKQRAIGKPSDRNFNGYFS